MRIVAPEASEMVTVAKFYCGIWREPPWLEEWGEGEVIADLTDLCDHDGILLIAETGDQIVGLTAGLPISREQLYAKSGTKFGGFFKQGGQPAFYIAELATAPEHRGKGIGRMLTLALCEQAHDRGFDHFVLRTHVDAGPARRLYRKLGFCETGIHDHNYPDRTYWVRIDN